MYATTHGCIDVVKILLENGADIEAKDYSGYTALEIAKTEAEKYIKITNMLETQEKK